jgi:hypothetical protein
MNLYIAPSNRRLFRLLACILVGLATPLAFSLRVASATPTGDQSYLPAGASASYFIESSQSVAQTFTAGITGDLTSVGVEIQTWDGAPGVPISVKITTVSGGAPDNSNVIGTGTISASDVLSSVSLINVPLTGTPHLTAGTQYAIVLSSSAPSCCGDTFYATDSEAGYAGGSEFTGNTTWSDDSNDMAFVTYVEAAAATLAGPRGAYCTVAGNSSDDGIPLFPGTFVNLDDGQINSDAHYTGATPAIFVEGVGLTCAPPPAGYTLQGLATAAMNVDANTYPYYAAP